jgi:glycosyltransferase involved in cell wall biosynthesis
LKNLQAREENSQNSILMLKNFLKRVQSKIVRLINSRGYFSTIRTFSKVVDAKSLNAKKLIIIAPGEIQIPSLGWGAVETIISETLVTYEAEGFEVWLLNSKHPHDWRKASKLDFDVILNHADSLSGRIRNFWPKTKIVVVSHYGLAAFPSLWDKGYQKILNEMKKCDYIVCLSAQIFEVFKPYFEESKLIISSNGTSFLPQIKTKPQNRILCLGKVEVRKKQYDLWKSTQNSEIEIIFAGPIVDERVLVEIRKAPTLSEVFIGPISREKLIFEFGNYDALILPSLGEADALVLYEAQMAGLSILVSKSGIGAQNPDLDWIHIISDEPSAQEINTLLNLTVSPSKEIAQYASENYNWKIRNKEVIKLLKRISNYE